ncbi:MAG TPA: TRAP transporter TatT component family protein, partial [Polyangiales bacterium]|nr:TRAP transporter TatT component family protein [Polyangiales bacterium]
MLPILRGALLALCAGASAACVNELAVDTTAGIMAEAEGSTRAYFDWESAGYAAPAGLMQLEGLHTVSPNNERLTLTLAKAYMAYAYGWVMDQYELAEMRGDYDEAKHHQQRAY